ncbi:MAG TPA: S1 RNA-binding domain-containing protein, partial [Sedimenticola sp.]|nr:S1 RNA-binding domain-containing protein [Sedimenticola sp.]
GKDDQSGALLLGHQSGHKVHDLAGLEQAWELQQPVDGRVTGVRKGGLEVEIAGVRAFCPASQIDIRFIEDLEQFVGQHLSFRITKFQGGRRPDLVVSRRALLEEEQKIQAEETRALLEEGAVLNGIVTSLKDYGAFVDLGGIEGMIHISELAFGHVQHPKDVLSEGQAVEVSVLRIEKTDNPRHPEKIALSIRALSRDPWLDAEQQFPVGSRVRGRVTRIQPFGAFVELVPGVEGMIHISELGVEQRVGHPAEVLQEGQSVEARVLSVDPEKRRIGLSLSGGGAAEGEGSGTAGGEDYRQPKKGGFGTLGDLLRESMEKQKRGGKG